jgi:hypothetical protein
MAERTPTPGSSYEATPSSSSKPRSRPRSLMAAFNAPHAPMKRGCPSDQATLLQEPHTVGGYRNALWWFTGTYQPATYLCVVDCRIDAVSDQRTMAGFGPARLHKLGSPLRGPELECRRASALPSSPEFGSGLHEGISSGANHLRRIQRCAGTGFCKPSRSKFCLANVDIVTLASATVQIVITEQIPHSGKIDPLMAAFNAIALMAANPWSAQPRLLWV